MEKIKINGYAILLYLFGMSILYLAAMSMGKGLLFIYYVALYLPLFSLVQLIISFLQFRYHQSFSTERPLKGEEIIYKLSLSNESFLSNVFVKISFKAIEFSDTEKMPDLYLRFKRFELIKKEFSVHCPYRGIYTVGLNHIMLRDFLGWCRIYPKVWFRTFYVYPRVTDLPDLFLAEESCREATGHQQGITDDITLIRGLMEYRNGDSIRHMAWKKFAALGQPFIRSYDKSSPSGIRIYLDLRRKEPLAAHLLEREDCSIEICVALVHFFLKRQIPVQVRAIGKETHEFQDTTLASFHRFHESTIHYLFCEAPSPLSLYHADLTAETVSMNTIIFLTHMLDPELFEMTTIANSGTQAIYTICNQSGWKEKQMIDGNTYITSIKERGGSVITVQSAETIKENLRA